MAGSAGVQPLVLVVETEPQVRRFLVSTLATNGFRSLHVGTRAGMLARAVAHEPDLVLISVGLRAVDVAGLTSRLRARTPAPILAVLTEWAEGDRRAIIEAGADDYVVKPFWTADLLERMRFWLQQAPRARRMESPSSLPAGRFRLDRERQRLFVEGRQVHVTPLECRLLAALSASRGGALSEDQVVAAVWGPGGGGHSQKQYLRAHMKRLREKLERDPAHPRFLVIDTGGRYRLKPS
jgi:two-component system KDP operon response regulator KdpE